MDSFSGERAGEVAFSDCGERVGPRLSWRFRDSETSCPVDSLGS